MSRIYLAGSMRNPEIVKLAVRLQAETGMEVFADWCAVGPEADDYWRDYCKARGLTYKQGLETAIAKNVFEFDKSNIDKSDIMIVAYPAGKSAHLELGYHIGRGKRGYILLDDQERWDVMLQFATGIFDNVDDIIAELREIANPTRQAYKVQMSQDRFAREADALGGSGVLVPVELKQNIVQRLLENSDRDYEI